MWRFTRRAAIAAFPKYTLDAFSYGTGVKRLYGTPVQVENIGLVVNTKLAHVPTSFADLEKQALAFKKKKSGNLALAVTGCHTAVRHFLDANRAGSIVNVSSTKPKGRFTAP